MAALGLYNHLLTLSCLCGVGLSLYAYLVHLNALANANYRALCDISERISCSRPVISRYGRGFGFMGTFFGDDSLLNAPNSLYGIVAYSLIATLANSNSVAITKVNLFLATLSNFASLYFAYILFIVLQDFCVICVLTYVVNFVNVSLSYLKLSKLTAQTKGKHE